MNRENGPLPTVYCSIVKEILSFFVFLYQPLLSVHAPTTYAQYNFVNLYFTIVFSFPDDDVQMNIKM